MRLTRSDGRSAATLTALLLVCWAGPRAAASDEPASREAALALARTAASELSADIRSLLMQELDRGGYEEAVRVCARAAQEKTAAFRARTGHDIRRVSLRYRNAANAPDDVERRVLESFDRLPRSEVARAEHVEVVDGPEGRTLSYLKPVVTAPLCLRCHGRAEEIEPAVRKVLDEQYPADRATGFKAGDVRGAVSVRVPLAAATAR
jgi:hypothetical protein